MKKFLLAGCLILLASGTYQAKNHHEAVFTSRDDKLGVELLNRLLANEFVLFTQTLHYHWNLVGPEFNDYHKLFDDQYNMLFADIDVVAERIRSIGGQALGSMKEMLEHATLKEDHGKLPKPKEMIKRLLKQYEHVIKDIRQDINKLEAKTNDHGTKKLLEDLLEKYEKTAWMLRSLTGKQKK